jgi:diguanylate cyclase (GGDEF)-like protein/PAS domain S-box-containing protein
MTQARAAVRDRRAATRGYHADPVLRALTGIFAAMVLLLVPAWGSADFHIMAFRLFMPPMDVALVILALRAADLPSTTRPVRRFYLSLAAAGLTFAIGVSNQAVLTVWAPSSHGAVAGVAQSAFQIVGTGIPLVAMLTFPTGLNTRRARARFWLDAATVMTAAAVFIWYFSMSHGAAAGNVPALVGSMVESGSTLVAVFAVVKLLLGGSAPFTRAAGLIGSASAAIDGLGKAVTPVLLDSHYLNMLLALRLLPAVLIAAAPRLQVLGVLAQPDALVRKPRLYSRMPYIAVAATNALLVWILTSRQLDVRQWVVVGGALTATLLVVIRQLTAFAENAHLLARLDASEQRFRSLVQYSSDITMIFDAENRVTYASPALQSVLGYLPESALGRDGWSLVHPEDVSAGKAVQTQLADRPREAATWHTRIRDHGGTWRWFEVTCTNLLGDPTVNGLVINAHDIHDARQYQDELRYQASHDPLTRLPNRSLFNERISAAADGELGAVLLIDLDGFKAVNDTFGHHVGDALLVATAERLRANVRPHDTVARLGGDEFAILLPTGTAHIAREVANRITATFADPIVIDGRRLDVGASVGLAYGSLDDPELLLRDADSAMYEAKRRGKDPGVLASR